MSTVLLIESDERLQRFWQAALTDEGFQVMTAATPDEVKQIAAQEPPDLVFLGTGLDGSESIAVLEALRTTNPDLLVVAPTNLEQVKQALDAMEAHGAVAAASAVKVDQVTIAIRDALEFQKLRAQARRLTQEHTQRFTFEQIVGESQAIRQLKQTLAQTIEADAVTVLISGQTGTGKELAARAIHYNGARRDRSFVVFDCTAVPPTLMETELFGHEAGAFTDAKTTKRGLLEIADGGTLFLDEVGDLEPQLQGKLLRVLEEKRFRRVGGMKELSVDVRFIAATNKDLGRLIKEGRFREDLYYRLSVFPIQLPPLRQHKEDLPLLAERFIEQFNREFRKRIKGLSPDAQQLLETYDWPGNVRELKNVIERAVILEQGEFLSAESFRMSFRPSSVQGLRLPSEGLSLKELERSLVEQALEQTQGNQTEAARLLGLSRFALRSRLKRLSGKESAPYVAKQP